MDFKRMKYGISDIKMWLNREGKDDEFMPGQIFSFQCFRKLD